VLALVEEYDRETIENLKRSLQQIGQIYAVIRDYDGEILSGRHRIKAGANIIHEVDSRKIAEKLGIPEKIAKLMIKLHSNVQRRMKREETQRMLLEMAKELEKKGVPKEKIASEIYSKYVPYSKRYVLELLPDEYKQVEFRPDIQHISDLHKGELVHPTEKSIENIHTEYEETTEVEEDKGEMEPERERVLITEEIIRDRMHHPVSNIEIAIANALNESGITGFLTQHPIVIQQTIPDFFFPDKRLAVYIDGPVHSGREDRDQELRDALRRRGYKVLELSYEKPTKETINRLVVEIILAYERD
jgi:very-short-patch-repair endonuclease